MPKPTDSYRRRGKFLISRGDPPPAPFPFSSSSWDPFPAAAEQHKHYPDRPSAGENSLPALVPGGWLLPDGDAAVGHVTFCSARSNPETVGGDVPTAGCLPRGPVTRGPPP